MTLAPLFPRTALNNDSEFSFKMIAAPPCLRKYVAILRAAIMRTPTILVLIMTCASHAVAADDIAEALYQLTHQGRAVGTLEVERRVERGIATTRERIQIFLAERGGRKRLSYDIEFKESTDGRPVRWQQTRRLGKQIEQRRLTVNADHTTATLRINGMERTVAVPGDVHFPHRLASSLHRLQRNQTLAASLWNPARYEWQHVLLAHDDRHTLEWTEHGRTSRVGWDSGIGQLTRNIELFGLSLELQRCSPAGCSAPISALDPLGSSILKSPYQLSAKDRSGRIRYLLAAAATTLERIPALNGQQLHWRGDDLVLTVCGECSPDAREDPPAADAIAPTAWLESDAPEVRALLRHARVAGDADRQMLKLASTVRAHLNGEVRYFDYLTAREAARARSGDCTEAALLLAATGRAAGIPTRVVAGVSYSSRFTGRRDVFSPHMWVQAWVGDQWRHYDAGLDGFDAGYIALAVGDGSPGHFADVLATIRELTIVDAAALPPVASARR